MAKYWKEEYSLERAKEAKIHTTECHKVLGDRNSKWIYYVEVMGFKFTFFSLSMLDQYIDFFSRKTLPTTTTHWSSPFSGGPSASVGDGQSEFERLRQFGRVFNAPVCWALCLCEAKLQIKTLRRNGIGIYENKILRIRR